MAYEFRDSTNYFYGTLANPAAISDTSISSLSFVPLPTDYSAGSNGKYLPLVLHDPSAGLYEVVWATGHAADSQTVTVVRGREGTSPRAWSAGTQVTVAPTVRDMNPLNVSTALPGSPHVGMRVTQTDKGVVLERTKTAGWMPSVGACRAEDISLVGLSGSLTPSSDATITIRAGSSGNVTTGSTGLATATFTNPFPNGCSGATVSSSFHAARSVTLISVSATSITVRAFNSSGGDLASTTISFNYIAFGW